MSNLALRLVGTWHARTGPPSAVVQVGLPTEAVNEAGRALEESEGESWHGYGFDQYGDERWDIVGPHGIQF